MEVFSPLLARGTRKTSAQLQLHTGRMRFVHSSYGWNSIINSSSPSTSVMIDLISSLFALRVTDLQLFLRDRDIFFIIFSSFAESIGVDPPSWCPFDPRVYRHFHVSPVRLINQCFLGLMRKFRWVVKLEEWRSEVR